jgi:hypothetical protein
MKTITHTLTLQIFDIGCSVLHDRFNAFFGHNIVARVLTISIPMLFSSPLPQLQVTLRGTLHHPINTSLSFFWLMLFFYIVFSEIRCLLLLCELIVILLLDRSTSPTKSPRSPAVGSPKDSHSGNSYNSPEHSEHNTINELGSDIIRSLSFSKIFTHYTQSFKLHSQTKRNDNISETNNQHFL